MTTIGRTLELRGRRGDPEPQAVPRVRLFGSIEFEHRGRRLGQRDFGGPKPKQVLEILLAMRGRAVPKDRLADLLWGEALPQNVPATLETYVSVLRRALDPEGTLGRELVRTEPGAYRFVPEGCEIDLDRFDQLVAMADHADGPEARKLLEEALALVRGDVFEDEPYAEWAERVRERYRQRLTGLRLDAAQLAVGEGDYGVGLAQAEHVSEIDPLNERAYRIAMVAAYALGRQERALRTFLRCRQVLAEELDVEPIDQTEAVFTAIRRHEDPRRLVKLGGRLEVAVGAVVGVGQVPALGLGW